MSGTKKDDPIPSEDTLREITEIDPALDCKLCCLPVQAEDSELQLGPMYEYGVCRAHHHCLMFSSGLEQNGEEEEGIQGFMPEDIIKEWRRGGSLKCFYCKKKYATVGCSNKGCRKGYHLPCGLANGSLQQFFGSFSSYCVDHRPVQKPVEKKIDGKKAKSDKECGVCLDALGRSKTDNLWTPCCGGWFHRACINRMAKTAGIHFFKCPLCNNSAEFTEEMQTFGIYVPDQDAKWETEGDAFEDLLQRPETCDAETCLCPGGRKVDEVDTKWESVICVVCGSQAIHIECGGLNFERPRWKCDMCKSILKNRENKPVSVFSRVKLFSSQENIERTEKLFERVKIKAKRPGGRKPLSNIYNIQVKVGKTVLSFATVPVLDVPKRVKLYSDTEIKGKPDKVLTKSNKKKEEEESEEHDDTDYMPSPLESALTNQNLNEETTGEKKRKLSSSGDEGGDEGSGKKKPRLSSGDKSQTSILSFFKAAAARVSESESPSEYTPDDLSPIKETIVGKIVDETENDVKKDEEESTEKEETKEEGKSPDKPELSVKKPSPTKPSPSAMPFVCQFCKIRFSSVLSWKQHENSHKSVVQCGVCDKKFAATKLLNKHVKSAHSAKGEEEEESEYPCDQCDAIFIKSRGLTTHKSKKHSRPDPDVTNESRPDPDVANEQSDQVYQCEDCPAIYITETALKIHQRQKKHGIEAKIREAESENDTESENDDSDNGDDDNASSYTYASDNEDKEIKLKITNIISEWNDDSRSNQ